MNKLNAFEFEYYIGTQVYSWLLVSDLVSASVRVSVRNVDQNTWNQELTSHIFTMLLYDQLFSPKQRGIENMVLYFDMGSSQKKIH